MTIITKVYNAKVLLEKIKEEKTKGICWLCKRITDGSDWCESCDKDNTEIENDIQNI